jgi:hypothetical protein
MTHRKGKRLLQESDEYVLFTGKKRHENYEMGCYYNNEDAWQVLLNIAIDKYHIRETLRNIINTADEYLKDNQDSAE